MVLLKLEVDTATKSAWSPQANELAGKGGSYFLPRMIDLNSQWDKMSCCSTCNMNEYWQYPKKHLNNSCPMTKVNVKLKSNESWTMKGSYYFGIKS